MKFSLMALFRLSIHSYQIDLKSSNIVYEISWGLEYDSLNSGQNKFKMPNGKNLR